MEGEGEPPAGGSRGRRRQGGAAAGSCPGTAEPKLWRGGGRPCLPAAVGARRRRRKGGASRLSPAAPPLVVRERQTHTRRSPSLPPPFPPSPSLAPHSPRRPERARRCRRVSGLPRPGSARPGCRRRRRRTRRRKRRRRTRSAPTGGRPSHERRGGGLLGLAPKVPTGEEVEALRECPRFPFSSFPFPSFPSLLSPSPSPAGPPSPCPASAAPSLPAGPGGQAALRPIPQPAGLPPVPLPFLPFPFFFFLNSLLLVPSKRRAVRYSLPRLYRLSQQSGERGGVFPPSPGIRARDISGFCV